MEAPMIYPTAPFDPQAHQLSVIDAHLAHAGTGENIESPGKAKAVLSKVKHKARKLKDKIKKVKGGNTAASTEHGDDNEHDMRDFNAMLSPNGKDFEDGAESCEGDEDDDDPSKPNHNQYEQLRSIGALDDQGDGSEVEVHGGVPVSTLADSPGTYWKRADNSTPISPYKSAGPPDALQASPTEYRNYAANDDPFLGGGKPTSSIPCGIVEENVVRGLDEENHPLGSPSLPEVEAARLSNHDPTEPHTKNGVPDPELKIANHARHEPVEPHSKHGISDTVSYPEQLVKPNPSFGMPIYDSVAVTDEDLSADRKLGVGLPSEEHGGSGNTSAPEFEPEGKMSNLSFHDPAEPHSKYGILDTASASDIDVSYPEDLVKPNPFGKSSSPTYDKIAVMNEDFSPDRKLGVGLSSEEHSGSGKGNLLEMSVPEYEELSGYRGSSSVPLEADELVYRPISDPEVGSSPTSPPGTLAGVAYEPDAVAHNSRSKGEHDASKMDTSSYGGEQKWIPDAASGQPADGGGIITAADSEHETWGKWSADKIKNAKEVTVSGLIGTDHVDENGTPEDSTDTRGTKLNSAVDVVGNAHEVSDSQDDDVGMPCALENENKDVEEEYYDPNELKGNQFQEGFTLGSAEEDALSGTLAGTAIEKLQGLKETVQSSLGYSNHDDSGAGGEERPGFEGEERALSPTSHQQQKGGFVQGLKETVASSLGYGKAASDDAFHNDDDVSEGGQISETDDGRRQQSGGTYQALKNVVASKLGYGTAEKSPMTTKATESREFRAEPTSLEPSYDEDREIHPNNNKAGHVLSNVRDTADREDEVSSESQQSGGLLQGVKDMVISKLGYNNQPELEIYGDANHTEFAGDHDQPSSYTDKLINTTAAARDCLSSRGGYHEDKGEGGNFDDGQKFTNPSTHAVNNSIDDNM